MYGLMVNSSVWSHTTGTIGIGRCKDVSYGFGAAEAIPHAYRMSWEYFVEALSQVRLYPYQVGIMCVCLGKKSPMEQDGAVHACHRQNVWQGLQAGAQESIHARRWVTAAEMHILQHALSILIGGSVLSSLGI